MQSIKKHLAKILTVSLLFGGAVVFAQTINSITIEQPINNEYEGMARYSGGHSPINASTLEFYGPSEFIARMVGIVEMSNVEVQFRIKEPSTIDFDNGTIQWAIECRDLGGTLCPAETNRITSQGHVMRDNGNGNYTPVFHEVKWRDNSNVPADYANYQKHVVDNNGNPRFSGSFNPSVTFDVSPTLHDYNSNNVYTLVSYYANYSSVRHYPEYYGTNTNLAPNTNDDIENLPLWQQILLGLSIQLDNVTTGGWQQWFSEVTGAFFKPYFSVDVDTGLSFATIASQYYQPDTGGGGSSVGTCNQENIVAQGFCLALSFLFVPSDNVLDSLGEVRDSLSEKFPFYYVFELFDHLEVLYDPTGSVATPVTIPFSDYGNITLLSVDMINNVPFVGLLRNTLIAALWIMFAMGMFNRVKGIFNRTET